MALSKYSCWHACPFDADLVLRKTGVRRMGDPRIPLALIGHLAQERGHQVQLLERVARLIEQDAFPGPGKGGWDSKEQAHHALIIDGKFFSLCGASSWEELLIHAHGCLASPFLGNTPSRYQQTGWLTHVLEQDLPAVGRKFLFRARAVKADGRRPTVLHEHPLFRMFRHGPRLPQDKPSVRFSAGENPPMDFWASMAYHLADRGVDCEVTRSKLTYNLPRPRRQSLTNEQWQFVRTTYTLNAGPMVFYGADDDHPSMAVRSAESTLALEQPFSGRVDPKYFLTPDEAGQAWRLIQQQTLDTQLPSALPEASAQPKARM